VPIPQSQIGSLGTDEASNCITSATGRNHKCSSSEEQLPVLHFVSLFGFLLKKIPIQVRFFPKDPTSAGRTLPLRIIIIIIILLSQAFPSWLFS
jgi:hypothetical protein